MSTPPPTLPDAPSTATSFPFNGVPSVDICDLEN
jgi:hypothetical protein